MSKDDIAVDGAAQGIEGAKLNIEALEHDSRLRSFSSSTESRISSLRQSADKVHDAFNVERQKLLREDGQRKYSEAEHKELEEDLKRQRDEAFSEFTEQADKLSAEIGEKLEVAAKPERYLPDVELERANARREFVREDVDRLPLGEVPGLLREAELTGDRVEKWLFSRYATIRADRELERLRESGGAGVNAEEVSRQMAEVREGSERLQEQIQPPGAKVRKRDLETLHQNAAGLSNHIRDKSLTHEERVAMSYSPL